MAREDRAQPPVPVATRRALGELLVTLVVSAVALFVSAESVSDLVMSLFVVVIVLGFFELVSRKALDPMLSLTFSGIDLTALHRYDGQLPDEARRRVAVPTALAGISMGGFYLGWYAIYPEGIATGAATACTIGAWALLHWVAVRRKERELRGVLAYARVPGWPKAQRLVLVPDLPTTPSQPRS